jgi:hypothetical protein
MKHKIIGLYQLITGIFGFIFILIQITKALTSIHVFFTFLVGLLLFAGVAYSGYALLNSLKNGVKYSLLSQALQVVSFTAGGIQYLFSASNYIYLLVQNKVSLEFHDKIIEYNISRVSDLFPFEIRIYLIPLLFVVLLSLDKK